MKTLIVGAGALGGIVAARMIAGGARVSVATRGVRAERLRVGDLDVAMPPERDDEDVELTVLATKAADAIASAPSLRGLVMPIQNGGVAELLAARLGADRVVGAISNLGATMLAPGEYVQRNDGHFLIDANGRGSEVAEWLGRFVPVRTTTNFRGAVWSKLLLNCSVTSIGAIAGETMRAYITRPTGRALFDRAYAEALAVALATGAAPERMLVEAIPPRVEYEDWLAEVIAAYGDLKPSMLQDFERGRRTEVDFINGYVCDLGARLGVPTPANAQIVEKIHAIEAGLLRPSPANL